MKTFEEYLKDLNKAGDVKLSKVSKAAHMGILSAMSPVINSGFLSREASAQFSEEITQLVESEEFIRDLSNEIGKPKPHESEDEFVERAKESMRELLREKLGDKG